MAQLRHADFFGRKPVSRKLACTPQHVMTKSYVFQARINTFFHLRSPALCHAAPRPIFQTVCENQSQKRAALPAP